MSEISFLPNADGSATLSEIIASICGWLYVSIWGAYLYPQIFLNCKLQSVEGFKLDYPYLNLTGYILLTICNYVGYYYTLPFKNYGLGNVPIQDLLFALNGTFVFLVLNIQAIVFKRGKNKISVFSLWFTIIAWVSSLALYIFSEIVVVIPPSQSFNILIYMGDIKVVINMVKAIPLLYSNFQRKSTEGISILAFVLNLVGAGFSLIQMGLNYANGTTDTINPVKTGLALATMFYDVILIIQYLIYKDGKKDYYAMEASLVYSSSQTEVNSDLLKSQQFFEGEETPTPRY